MFTKDYSDSPDIQLPVIFQTGFLPVFQNMFYSSRTDALSAAKGKMSLVQHPVSGLVYNDAFDPALLDYLGQYNNEQGHSEVFKDHLSQVFDIFSQRHPVGCKVIEIGTGKGAFWELLSAAGYNCTGYDPAYEGDDPRVFKEYFSERHNDTGADVFILRHTLEHIQHPFRFLHTIAKANNYKGHVFIEVPTFDWILGKNAFWDIFYEHVNYFTCESISGMFEESVCENIFGGQYIYLSADLSRLRKFIPHKEITPVNVLSLLQQVEYYTSSIQKETSVAIWGAGGKGSTFLNTVDPGASKIRFAIDINPFKQNKYIGGTGHKIYSPDILHTEKIDHVIVMNENYLNEIRHLIKDKPITLSCL